MDPCHYDIVPSGRQGDAEVKLNCELLLSEFKLSMLLDR